MLKKIPDGDKDLNALLQSGECPGAVDYIFREKVAGEVLLITQNSLCIMFIHYSLKLKEFIKQKEQDKDIEKKKECFYCQCVAFGS